MTRKLILPPLVRTARDAETFARHAHLGQLDKVGDTYICHLERVAARVREWAPFLSWDRMSADEIVQAAWLHDVVEDTPYSFADLRREGFSEWVNQTVQGLTKDTSESYQEWIEGIATDVPSVILVKLADNLDNADPRRVALVAETDRDRLRSKYEASIPVLREAAFSYGWKPPGVETISGLWPDRSPASSDRGGL